jgi:hypothetical protein
MRDWVVPDRLGFLLGVTNGLIDWGSDWVVIDGLIDGDLTGL